MPGTTVGGGGPAVLEDPTGTRARWMHRAGRVVFLLFLGWLLAIVLGGLGLMPVAGIPLTHVLRPSHGPPPLAKLPKPREPSASDLRPAVPAAVFAARTAKAAQRASHSGVRKTTPAARVSPGKSATSPGQVKKTSTLPAVKGKSTAAPGQIKKTSTLPAVTGKATAAPGQIKKTSTLPAVKGKSAVAPGQTKTAPTASASHGKSTVAPGQTKTTTTPVRQPKKP